MRRPLEWVGRGLITTGALLVLFVAYQLWGTGLIQAAEQRDLKGDFRETAAATATPEPERARTGGDTGGDTAPTTPPVTAPPPGEALGILSVPAIGLEQALVEGAGREELKKGPGHYPHSPLPGHAGNVSLAGHRTTYGAPFNQLDELKPGDQIVVETVEGRFTYVVTETRIVAPGDVSVIDGTDDNRITLTTCNPEYSSRERLVVVGHLRGEPVAAPPPPEVSPPKELASEATPEHLDAGSPSGLDGIRRETVGWTLLLLGAGAAWWGAVHRRAHWTSWAAPALPFLFVLFFFFGEVERLLPAGY